MGFENLGAMSTIRSHVRKLKDMEDRSMVIVGLSSRVSFDVWSIEYQ